MRYSIVLSCILLLLVSCKSTLIISDVSVKNIQNRPNNFLPDSSIILLVAPYKSSIDKDMLQVISFSDKELTKAKPESKLTNLMADLLMEEGRSFIKMNNWNISLDMAYVNYGGLRTSLPKGEITVGNIFELMPFENEMILLQLTGENMAEFIQRIAERGGDGVAGITLGIRDGEITHCTIGGKAIDEKRNYWLVTNDYIAQGGDDMKVLLKRKEYLKTNMKLRDIIIDNLNNKYQSGNRIPVKLDGRIYNE